MTLNIELTPLRPAIPANTAMTFDVLLKITPPLPQGNAIRPHLNLGLVLDRSGSMEQENKIEYARAAARFAVQELLPTDRVSVTIFDSEIQTVVPNTFAENKAQILQIIDGIQPRHTTALHAGWKEGSAQVGATLIPGRLNRVLLLSDGLANVGETNSDIIASDVRMATQRGVSTTTLGLGVEYNEDLLEAMAISGDGNYYYIQSPQQLPVIFAAELSGLIATFGSGVTFSVESDSGAQVADLLNDFEKTPTGEWKLPNLIAGMPQLILVRLQLPLLTETCDLCRFNLAWQAPNAADRQQMSVSLRLPVVDFSEWGNLAEHVEVQERTALLLIARLKRTATDHLNRGNSDGAATALAEAKRIMAAAPNTPEMRVEAQALALIEEHLLFGAPAMFLKAAKFQSHQRVRNKPYQK